MTMNIPIAKPYLGEAEREAALQVLSSGALVQGAKVAAFEQQFAGYHGVKHGVAMGNGTLALIAALMAHEIGPGDEVILPAFTFFATASSVLCVGAKPVFADIDPVTFCLSPESAEQAITERTRAIMPVHLYGHPADMPRFDALCSRQGLVLLEDAAQAHGASIGDRKVGSWGTASFSFYPTKNMTTTEGGMVLTQSDDVARRLRLIRNQGMDERYYHEALGFNFRMTEICAAIGLEQLKRLPGWTERRQQNARHYDQTLTRVSTPPVRDGYGHVYHQYTVRVPAGVSRDLVMKQLNARGVGARVYYPLPIHQQPVFKRMEGYATVNLPHTLEATAQVMSLPVHPLLTREELDYVTREVNASC